MLYSERALTVLQVNNAGQLALGTIEETSLDQYDQIMNCNVRYIESENSTNDYAPFIDRFNSPI